MSIRRLRKAHDGVVYRPYLCECGLWHISTKAAISDTELRRENIKLRERNEGFKKDNKRLRAEVVKLRQEISKLITKNINDGKI